MRSLWCASLLLSVAAFPARADPDQDPQNLSNLSIEELAQIPVRSASKQEEPLSAATTALYVITSDDIERSAATSIPEVLRMAPNLHVERLNAAQYAISARGFNGYETSNKLLVLIDGRSVYSTLHSGVFWELHSALPEDLRQIEVISGPGGTLYGPNAMNGVISITSKDASETLGLLAHATAGGNERTASARYGLALGKSAAVRVYANYFDREDLPTQLGPAMNDRMSGWQTGFRSDFDGGASHMTVQGDVFGDRTFQAPGDGNRGQDMLARWNRDLTANSSIELQGYYDYYQRRATGTKDSLETGDVQGQYNLHTGAHNLVTGIGLRTTRDVFVNNVNIFQLAPPRERLWVWNGFMQDRFAVSHEVSVIAGVKLEGSTFSGVQVLPNLRFAWQPSEKALFWTSVSRAVRTPSRIDRNLTAAGILATAPDFQSEKVMALEAGYRGQPARSTSLSLSLFYNRYDDIRSARGLNPSPVFLPLQLANDTRGYTYGVEAWGTQQLTPWWRVSGGATWLHKSFEVRPGQVDFTAGAALGSDPSYQLSLRSQMTLPRGIRFDAGLRAVDALQKPHVDGYVEADARLGWSVSEGIELFVAGDNLLHATHLESNDINRTQLIERNVFFGARLRI